MKIVISCAGSKEELAGYMQTCDGKRVIFVAQPKFAPQKNDNVIYAAPDGQSDRQVSWRTLLEEYNKNPGNNPLNFYPAYKLYRNKTYKELEKKFGVEHLYILSAGWGMIRADFLTPQYDITFSPRAERYERRKEADDYKDFQMLPDDDDGPIRFFGGKDYIPLFCSLTEKCRSRRIVFYNSAIPPDAPGCDLKRCVIRSRTNWHYECAKSFMSGDLRIDTN
jgi:hypothetical protein